MKVDSLGLDFDRLTFKVFFPIVESSLLQIKLFHLDKTFLFAIFPPQWKQLFDFSCYISRQKKWLCLRFLVKKLKWRYKVTPIGFYF